MSRYVIGGKPVRQPKSFRNGKAFWSSQRHGVSGFSCFARPLPFLDFAVHTESTIYMNRTSFVSSFLAACHSVSETQNQNRKKSWWRIMKSGNVSKRRIYSCTSYQTKRTRTKVKKKNKTKNGLKFRKKEEVCRWMIYRLGSWTRLSLNQAVTKFKIVFPFLVTRFRKTKRNIYAPKKKNVYMRSNWCVCN